MLTRALTVVFTATLGLSGCGDNQDKINIGAKNFGFPTFWVRRYGQPLDSLGLEPDLIVTDLNGLADALGA